MTDQPKPGKFKRVLKGIFIFVKWIFVLLLAVLFIAGLYFQAPWKVLVLIAIFFCAITILPKRFRKYFWLSTVCAIVILAIWVFLPEDNTGWKQYTCQKEIDALNEKYKIPDDQNAAVIYEQVLDNLEKDDLSYDFKDYKTETKSEISSLLENSGLSLDFKKYEIEKKMMSEPWHSKDHPGLAAWLAGHEKTIAILSDATSYDQCFFSYDDHTDILKDIIPRVGILKSCSKLLRLAAQNDIAEGRTAAALDKYKIIMTMADHLYQCPSLIEILVSIALEAVANNCLKEFAMDFDLTESDKQSIEDILSIREHDWQKAWPIVMDVEKMMYYKLFYAMYDVNEQGQIRFTRSRLSIPLADILGQLIQEDKSDYWATRRYKLSAFLSWFVLPTDPAQMSEGIEQMHHRYYEMTKEDWQSGPREFSYKSIKLSYPHIIDLFQYISEPALYKVYAMHSRVISDKKVTRIILALKNYHNKTGSWPENLEQLNLPSDLLVDSINNDSFVYKVTGEDFTIYSKGPDLVDDGGDRFMRKDDGSRIDDFRFWPPRSRLEEEDAKNVMPPGMMMPGMPGMPGISLPPGIDPNLPGMGMPGMPLKQK